MKGIKNYDLCFGDDVKRTSYNLTDYLLSSIFFQVHTTSIGYYCAFSFWIAISVIWIYFIICFLFVRIYVFFACVFYIYCHWQYAGVQNLALQLSKQRQKQEEQMNHNSE